MCLFRLGFPIKYEKLLLSSYVSAKSIIIIKKPLVLNLKQSTRVKLKHSTPVLSNPNLTTYYK